MRRYDMNKLGQDCLTTAAQLSRYLKLDGSEEKHMAEILEQYPMRIPPYYLSLIDPAEGEKDPIRRMCIPSLSETDLSGTFDTSGEESNTVMRGLQHKYHQTALILSTPSCAMYCRHCFRKRLVGADRSGETRGEIASMAAYVAAHPEINNVLVTGGDAFMNDNDMIKEYLSQFSRLDNLDLIRFGTRIPVVLPERIYEDEELLCLLSSYGKQKQIFVVTQFNHPRELTPESTRAIKALMEAGIVIRNQTVLLKGINDDPAVLADLLNGLTARGVLPYYVFQCRPVTGVKNQFQVPLLRGIDIIEKTKTLQNGQGKNFRYCMSHPLGKIEVAGRYDGKLLMKFHQAKYDEDAGRIFSVSPGPADCWLSDELIPE